MFEDTLQVLIQLHDEPDMWLRASVSKESVIFRHIRLNEIANRTSESCVADPTLYCRHTHTHTHTENLHLNEHTDTPINTRAHTHDEREKG